MTAAISPWDQRLARLLVRPLARTGVTPNQVTGLSLAAGVAAATLFAAGGRAQADFGALCFMLAMLIDHADGELARMTGKTSRLGHHLDYIVGSLNYTLLFIGLGIGLEREWGEGALAIGLGAGLSNPLIVAIRMRMDQRFGAAAVEHPSALGFEIEDFAYLIGPITWILGPIFFLVPYGLGTLGYFGWTVYSYARERRRH
ncbi:MAG: CDP-alcohol phosphatidyltransferase family protein [Alphaproteobacteria bacterium]